MGKNQAYKAMQRAKMATQTGPGGTEDVEDGMMDGSFHSPEWHAARLASLQTSHTITWEEYKRRQKDEAKKKEEQEDGEVRLMKEYRAQLDAERACKLARGRNHDVKKLTTKGKKGKDKERRKKPNMASTSQNPSSQGVQMNPNAVLMLLTLPYDNLTPLEKPKPYKGGGQAVTLKTLSGFDDRKKALSFLQQFDKAYAGGNFTEASKVRKAATYLTGNAGQ
ncbi:hypothetical protein L7F22_008955 [Adiantum nelumboides]|nr:hypothetical protein [Adiantum nelumboides]